MKNLYSVKQASKILGFSTNTIYKYLNEGQLKGVRSSSKGRFRITKESLEDFLGSQLPKIKPQQITKKQTANPAKPTLAPTLNITTTRLLLAFITLLLIADLFLNQNFSLPTNLLRGSILFIILLLTYQYGGVKNPRP